MMWCFRHDCALRRPLGCASRALDAPITPLRWRAACAQAPRVERLSLDVADQDRAEKEVTTAASALALRGFAATATTVRDIVCPREVPVRAREHPPGRSTAGRGRLHLDAPVPICSARRPPHSTGRPPVDSGRCTRRCSDRRDTGRPDPLGYVTNCGSSIEARYRRARAPWAIRVRGADGGRHPGRRRLEAHLPMDSAGGA